MGDAVLATTITGTGTNVANLLVYCHCSRRHSGGLSMLFINTDPAADTTIKLSFVTTAAGSRWDRVEYELTPIEEDMHALALNGVKLAIKEGAEGDWIFPSLLGKHIPNRAGSPSATLSVASQGYRFLEFPNAMASPCKSDDGVANLSNIGLPKDSSGEDILLARGVQGIVIKTDDVADGATHEHNNKKHLLLDRSELVSWGDGVEIAMKRSLPTGDEALLVPDRPWEIKYSFYDSVVDINGSSVALHYNVIIPGGPSATQQATALALSSDGGQSFAKPQLGLVYLGGGRRTLSSLRRQGRLPSSATPRRGTAPVQSSETSGRVCRRTKPGR
jgi:hypothetical protein